MYVTNSNFVVGTVSVIDTATNTVIDTDPSIAGITPIPVGSAPVDIAYDSIDERMYVTNNDDGPVSVIDTNTNTVISTIPVGANPQGIAYDF